MASCGQQRLALSRCAVKNGVSAYSPQQVCLENTVGRLVKRPRVQLSPCLQQPQRHFKASSQTGKEDGSGGGGRGVPRCPRPLTHGAPILCSVHSSGGPLAGARGVRSSLQPRGKGAGSGWAELLRGCVKSRRVPLLSPPASSCHFKHPQLPLPVPLRYPLPAQQQPEAAPTPSPGEL